MDNTEKTYNAVLDTEPRAQQVDNELTVPSLPFCIIHIPEHTHPLIPVELSLQEQQ